MSFQLSITDKSRWIDLAAKLVGHVLSAANSNFESQDQTAIFFGGGETLFETIQTFVFETAREVVDDVVG